MRARELLIEGAERRGVAAAVGGQRLARDVEHGGAVEARFEQPDQRLRRRQPVRERRELGRRQIQEAVALEELAFAREQRRAITLGLRAQLAQQRRGELVGARRRRRVDDDQEIAIAQRKRVAVLVEVLPPRNRRPRSCWPCRC